MKKTLMAILCAWVSATSFALAGAEQEMLEADRAFAAMAAEKGAPAAFAAFAAEDVRMFPGGSQPYAGRDQMIEEFSDWPEGAVLEWSPVEAVAAPGGDFGFTWGRYIYTSRNEAGEENVGHGKYVSVWRREAAGAWKFVADIGNANPDPAAPE